MFFFFADGVKKVVDEASDYRRHLSTEALLEWFRNSVGQDIDGNVGDVSAKNVILMFSSELQQSWLVVAGNDVFCVIDDIRKSDPKIKWRKKDFVEGNLNLRVESLTDNTGRIFFDEDSRMKFSKKFFSDLSVIERVSALIQRCGASRRTRPTVSGISRFAQD